MTLTAEVQKLEPGNIVELFELDLTPLGGSVLRWHSHTQQGMIYWADEEYSPWPMEIGGFAKTTGQPPTPSLKLANLEGVVSALCREYDDLAGMKITRRRTFVKYLDPQNFPGPNMNTDHEFKNGLTGYTIVGSANVTDQGAAAINVAGSIASFAKQVTGLTPGVVYKATFDVIHNSAPTLGGATLHLGSTATNSTYGIFNLSGLAVGRQIMSFVAPAGGSIWFRVRSNTTNAVVRVKRVYIQTEGENPDADNSQEFMPEIWYVEKKVNETKEQVELELASALDLNGVQLPRRQIISNYCSWLSIGGYRGPYCNYTGPAVARADDTPTTVLEEDACSGKLTSCKLRQWPDGVLNFGGFPAAGLMRS